MIRFTVIGTPRPAGSKRAFVPRGTSRPVIVDANANAKPWKQEVASVAASVANGLLTAPLQVALDFYVARPKAHYRTGKNAHLLRDSAPAFPAVKPDVDKLSRAVLDALSGVVYRDDAQIVEKVVRKRYGTPERVEVEVMLA